jgi:SAM-dependent methyltransferase
MVIARSRFQGVVNILRFNWHFYVGAILLLCGLLFASDYLVQPLQTLVYLAICISIITIAVSLLVSYYVYDYSKIYDLKWIADADHSDILNINAGFDETTDILRHKFPNARITSCDFYNEHKHTEISIKRARLAYPPADDVIKTETCLLPFADNSFNKVLAIFSAHEIRNDEERVAFFKELSRVTKPSGQILVTEHLRDISNFLAYTVGFMHFFSKESWKDTFRKSHLNIVEEIKTTAFVTTFILVKNGAAH